jgi:3-hydroxybutyryl-CoA dehydratase
MTAPIVDRFVSLTVGQRATSVRTVTDCDVIMFAAVTGDLNPVHVDQEHGAASRFGGRIAHGMFAGGLISALMASELPGPGAIYLSQSLRFVRPVLIGDTLTVSAEVVELFTSRRRVRVATICRNQRDEVVVDGEAMLMLPKDP